MASTSAAPQQVKQPSRKGKRAWRKHVDLSEIQSGLEDVRGELIQGGVVAEKPSDELFAVDTTRSNARPTITLPRRGPAAKPLKADLILGQRSAIPAVDSRKRAGGMTDGVLEPRSKRHRTPYVDIQEYQRLRRIGAGATLQATATADAAGDAPTHDPWAVAAPVVPDEQSYLPPARSVREPPTLKAAPESLLASARAPAAVARPKPGTSYNPAFEDWDALLAAEGEKEVVAELTRRAAAEAEEERQALIAAAEAEAEQEAEDSAWEGFESECEAKAPEWARPKRVKIKTRADRNRIGQRKEAERLERARAKEREKEVQAQRVKAFAREMKRAKAAGEKQTKDVVVKEPNDEEGAGSEAEEDEQLRRHLKKSLLPPQSLELVLPDELQDSLRKLRPEGNLLRERFRSAVVRGRVEPRKPITQPRKPKRFLAEKWSYKDFPVAI